MLGFSLPKILLLCFIILFVWYGFKIIEKRTHINKDKSSKNNKKNSTSKFKADNVQDLEKCPVCSNYFLAGSKCSECNATK